MFDGNNFLVKWTMLVVYIRINFDNDMTIFHFQSKITSLTSLNIYNKDSVKYGLSKILKIVPLCRGFPFSHLCFAS